LTAGSGESAEQEIIYVMVARKFVEHAGREAMKKLEEWDELTNEALKAMVKQQWERSSVEEVRALALEWKRSDKAMYDEITRLPKKRKSPETEVEIRTSKRR
jgi:hypothetical protein